MHVNFLGNKEMSVNKKFVLFDFDGVIANTEKSNCKYLEETLACFGIYLTDKDRQNLIGSNDKMIINQLLARSSQNVSYEQWLLKRKEFGNTYENGDIKPMPELILFIKFLKEKGFKIGIVTSTKTKLIIIALNRMNMTSLFDVIICGDMCTKNKPDPQCYQKAMFLLKANPEECIIFEDSEIGIHAAKQTGALVVAYGGSGIIQNVKEADIFITSYAECYKKLNKFLY